MDLWLEAARLKLLIDIVLDAEEAQEQQDATLIPATEGNESEDSDEMPELESFPDDENEEVFIPIKTLHRADPDRVVQLTDVSIMVYPDNTIRVDKNTDELVKLRQIVNGPIFSSIMFYEQWATGDKEASKALTISKQTKFGTNLGKIHKLTFIGWLPCFTERESSIVTEISQSSIVLTSWTYSSMKILVLKAILNSTPSQSSLPPSWRNSIRSRWAEWWVLPKWLWCDIKDHRFDATSSITLPMTVFGFTKIRDSGTKNTVLIMMLIWCITCISNKLAYWRGEM